MYIYVYAAVSNGKRNGSYPFANPLKFQSECSCAFLLTNRRVACLYLLRVLLTNTGTKHVGDILEIISTHERPSAWFK